MISNCDKEIDVPKLVLEALERTQDYITASPLEYSRYLSDQVEGEVWLKLDQMLPTSSFKYRGAVNKIMSLTDEVLGKGSVAASSGNFALAITEAAKLRNHKVPVYVSEDMDPTRIQLLKNFGVDVVIHNGDALDTERAAIRISEKEGRILLHPFNDPVVIGGQGTCGYEISQQLSDVDAVLFACGGGGLIAGGAGWLKHHNSEIEIYGVQPENSPSMHNCFKADKLFTMDTLPTIADTCAGSIDLDSITFGLCQRYVDDFLLLSEDEIADAMRLLFNEHRLVVEGSGALGVAAILKNKEFFKGKKSIAVICGKNIDIEVYKNIVK